MKRIALASAILVLAAGAASAHPTGKAHNGYHAKSQTIHKVSKRRVGKLNRYERFKIARSRARIAKLKRLARADGRVSFQERRLIRMATVRHQKLVRRAKRN